MAPRLWAARSHTVRPTAACAAAWTAAWTAACTAASTAACTAGASTAQAQAACSRPATGLQQACSRPAAGVGITLLPTPGTSPGSPLHWAASWEGAVYRPRSIKARGRVQLQGTAPVGSARSTARSTPTAQRFASLHRVNYGSSSSPRAILTVYLPRAVQVGQRRRRRGAARRGRQHGASVAGGEALLCVAASVSSK